MNTEAQTQQPQDLNVIEGDIVEVKPPEAALAVMNPVEYTRQLFEPFHQQITQAKRRASRAEYDITTKEGLATAEQVAKTFTKIRTSADKAKTEAKRPIDQVGKLILSGYNDVITKVRIEEDRRYQEISDEKGRRARIEADKIAAERARIEAIEARLAHIRGLPASMQMNGPEAIQMMIDALLAKQLDPALYDEHLEDAAAAMIETVEALRGHLQAALAREEAARVAEENARELARMKADQAERERIAAQEQAARDAQFQRERAEAQERQRQIEAQQFAMQQQQEQMRAEHEKQQGIMHAIKEIQNRSNFTGTALELLDAIESAEALDTGEAFYGGMSDMAAMAKNMAVMALRQSYRARLEIELPAAYDEALAMNAEREAGFAPATPEQVEALGEQLRTEGIPEIHSFRVIEAEPMVASAPPEVFHAPACPPLVELLDVLAEHYETTPATVAGWLLGLNQFDLALVA